MLCKEDRQRYSKSSLLCRRKGGVRTESIYVDMIKMRKKGFAPVNRVAGRGESHCCRLGWQRKTAFLLAWQAEGIIVKIPSNTDKKDSVSRWNAEHPRNLGDDDRDAEMLCRRRCSALRPRLPALKQALFRLHNTDIHT